MDEIARQAGVGIGTLYRHFPSRDDLILALVADDLERLATRADEFRAGTDAGAVEQWLAELIRHNLTYRGLAESIADAVTRHTALGAACERLHDAGAALVRKEQDDGTIRSDIDPHVPIDLAAAVAWSTQDAGDDGAPCRAPPSDDGRPTPLNDAAWPPVRSPPCRSSSSWSSRSSMVDPDRT